MDRIDYHTVSILDNNVKKNQTMPFQMFKYLKWSKSKVEGKQK